MKIEEKLCRVLLALAREFGEEVVSLKWERQTGRKFSGVDRPFVICMKRNCWLENYLSELLETGLDKHHEELAREIIESWRSLDTSESVGHVYGSKAVG